MNKRILSITLTLIMLLSVIQPTTIMTSSQDVDTLGILSPITISGCIEFDYRVHGTIVPRPQPLWAGFPIIISYELDVSSEWEQYTITGETYAIIGINGSFSRTLDYRFPIVSGSATAIITMADHASFVAEFSK